MVQYEFKSFKYLGKSSISTIPEVVWVSTMEDSFGGTSGTVFTGRVPDVLQYSTNTWIGNTAAYQVNGTGTAEATSGTTQVYYDVDDNIQRVTCEFNTVNGNARVWVNASSANQNAFQVRITSSGTILQLSRFDGGTATVVGEYTISPAVSPPQTVVVEAINDYVLVYFQGQLRILYSISDRPYKHQDMVAFRVGSPPGGWNHIRVETQS